ncbi:GntR family transcriptional regulator [Actinoallomurus bryophytorum]|uniref:TetR family transcriptional regulator n=1 Tax=Actinoallomurus bryophytorum TaxID=1490222 RepID=A0A543CI73_9ACTN|nr:GntR family transcriptional regulator [Actinoallomurus bryophytorum]TQL96781.1 TetR family transcriptional regulator [Actinoallomurus bryophytorum]
MAAKADPPYLRIAAELRRRIADGELAPGDRVPSTRQITREWGVALATATKALATLRRDGFVLAKPRAGHVVSGHGPGPARRHRGTDQELNRERVVRAAIEIADTEGLAALSMRGVASRLGVAAMSPYRYVDGKDDLVILMADAAYGEGAFPAELPEGWRARMELGARVLWTLHRRHPWLARIGSPTRPPPPVHAEWALSALDGHGLDPATILDVHLAACGYVRGIAAGLEHPVFAAGGRDRDDLDLDELFETGLKLILDGLALRIDP